ncbi:MAG: single-stranded-DNA-specific exonuclease RecJ [Chitinophagaceae bacterium]|nr:single-stranded-DNA-specific exonuclease RecJ [Chitinophagaceae bacterium]MCW5925864.1 single-stranded-DNA-specific exonuclease RecJ [Chitinophagaceae bacterium]
MDKKWQLKDTMDAETEVLHQALKIHPVLCRLLAQRGIYTFDEAKYFFRPELSRLHDPYLMKDMDKAVQRLLLAFSRNEKILVFGDYDVDGTTAVSCMYQFLQDIYIAENIDYYIPHRYREGYGVSKQGIDYAHKQGISLIISLDCGIKSVELIAYARSLDIEFIVCDHHLPDAELPPAAAILNPKQHDCNYPYKELCGCGVGFKLITALAQHFNMPAESYYRYLDLVATAIAADIVPMTGENRIIAYYGVKQVNESPSAGIRALMELSGLKDSKVHITNLVFVIAPRVNAAGRMDDARKAVQLFIEKDFTKALEYAGYLHSDNDDRKEADSNITEEALQIISGDQALIQRKTTVVYQPHWHKGVVGIVASRLIERYFRPTIVLTKSGDVVAGSARSVPGFNLYEAIHACRSHLLGYGGHFAAAGMTMLPEQVIAFSNRFEEVVNATIPEELLIPVLDIDSEITFADISQSFYNIISQMEPFGPDNLRPVFICRNVTDTGYSKLVKEQHIRFSLKQGNAVMHGIGFNLSEKFELLKNRQSIDIVFTIDENEWNGEKNLQLKVIDLAISHP